MVSAPLLELTENERQARDIERRRREEESRKERIFDVKGLRMGLDLAALDRQIKEKKENEKKETERDRRCDAEALYFGAVEEMQRQEQQHQRQQTQKEVAAFNCNAARKRQLKEEFEAQAEKAIGAEQYRNASGVSSLLFLEGEDEGYLARIKQQQQQQREALQEHLFQKELLLLQERGKDADLAEFHALTEKAAEATRQQQMKVEAQNRLETAKTNLELAEERRRRDEAAREAEKELERKEVDMKLHDPFLAEGRRDFITGDSSLSPWLPRAPTGALGKNLDGFKGYPLEVRQEAAAANEEEKRQIEQRQRRQEETEREWSRYAEAQRRHSVILEREKERQRRQTAESVAEMNSSLGREQRDRETLRNNELCRAAIGVEYNSYFSTTSR